MRSTFKLDHVDGFSVVEDQDQGMSVTNDAENVVRDVLLKYPKTRAIIYSDTQGNWDQLLFDEKGFTKFKSLNTRDKDRALWLARRSAKR